MLTAAKLSKTMFLTMPIREWADFNDRLDAPYAERVNETSGCTWPPMPDARRTEENWLSYGMQDRPGGIATPDLLCVALGIVRTNHRFTTGFQPEFPYL